jgi:hypothetical protein
MPELDVFPIAVSVENPLENVFPFKHGSYTFPVNRRPYTLFVKFRDPLGGLQPLMICFQGVTYDPGRSPKFQVDDAKVRNFYESVVRKKRDLKTTGELEYVHSFEEVRENSEMRVTRGIPFEEDVAVYELAIEALNTLLVAARCGTGRLSSYQLFDEDYMSALRTRRELFYHYIPEFEPQSRVRHRKFPLEVARYPLLGIEDYKSKVLPVLRNRKGYVLDELIASANKSFFDGEYEASLVLLESVFEAMAKEKIEAYYNEMPFPTDAERDRTLKSVLQKDVKSLIREEYPKCRDAKWFCDGVPIFKKWTKLYDQRNGIVHRVQTKGRLSKEEALKAFEDFRDVFKYLFDIESSYR